MKDIKVNFEFVQMGAELEPVEGKVALDVGNRIEPGILDHHQHEGKSCTVNSVMDHPDYVTDWIKGDEVTFVLHQTPDIDGSSAAYMCYRLLRDGEFPYASNIFAEHIKNVDQGIVERPNPKAPLPYEIYMIAANDIFDEYKGKLGEQYGKLGSASEEEKKEIFGVINGFIQERDSRIARKCFDIIDFLFEKIKGIPLEEIDLRKAFSGYHPFKDECKSLERDLELYTQDLHDHARTQPFILKLPRKGTRTPKEVDGLFWEDPKAKLFKLWARTDANNAQKGDGFIFLFVEFTSGAKNGSPRWVLSVDPNTPVDLVGLGDTLNFFEEIKREEKEIVIDEPPRSGYKIPDPWYDGRGHDYTIVDTPIRGSALERPDVENYIRSFTYVDLFFKNEFSDASVQFFFYFRFDPERREQIVKELMLKHCKLPEEKESEFQHAFSRYIFNPSIANSRQTVILERAFRKRDLKEFTNLESIQIVLTNQGTGMFAVKVFFQPTLLSELFMLNSEWKLGFSLQQMIDRDDIGEAHFLPKLLEPIGNIDFEKTVASHCSWSVRTENMHFSRDPEYYDQVLAAFVSYKPYPINIMQADLESIQDNINLGQYGRIIVRANQSLLFVNNIDQEMSKEEQYDAWNIYNVQCNYVMLNTAVQRSLVDGLMEDLAEQSEKGMQSRALLDQLQLLRARAMDMVNKGVTFNLTRNALTADYWDRVSKIFRLVTMRENVVKSISDLTEYVETSRSRSTEKIVFILSVLVGPLTLLTDQMGGVLGDVYPGVPGFLKVVAVTYLMAITTVAAIVFLPKFFKSKKTK